MTFSPHHLREQFPILQTQVYGKPLVYLDNAATSQKPRCVLSAMNTFYENQNANVHRGVHWLSQVASEAYESTRAQVAKYLGTPKTQEVIFTRGTTDAINLVASSWGLANLTQGDTVAVTRMDHHSNFVPWQQLCAKTGATFRIIELNEDFQLDEASLEAALALRPKLLALPWASNTLGTINPVLAIAKRAKAQGAFVLVDAAQALPHLFEAKDLLDTIDFLAFSSHKLFGPTGLGVLWGREALLNRMPPIQFGGDMVLRVEDHHTQWNELPWKFEAGTPAIAEVIGLGAALKFLESLDAHRIREYEENLTQRILQRFLQEPGVQLIGPGKHSVQGAARLGVFSFLVDGVHTHDISQFLDQQGIAVRAGHHCTQPLMSKLGIAGTTRASFAFYNTFEEAEVLFQSIQAARRYFQ